jgi:tRNA (cytidine/uridine-2'-O-)-methyltransferase
VETTTHQRLRAEPTERAFEILLVEPEIPPNTGNIGRLCAATGSRLHLVEPLGFRIDEHAVRRAGLDYWPLVQLRTHPNYAAAEQHLRGELPERRFWLFSGKTTLSYLDVPFRLGDVLVFGKESVGLPAELLERDPSAVVGIPTLGAVRSLNLANAVSIALYEALRQVGALAPSTLR